MVDDFLSNNVNAFSGNVLLCDTYVVRMYQRIIESIGEGRSCFSFTPELGHIDQLGFKLTTAFRLGRVKSLYVLTKDGSPHSLQIPLIVQEAAINTLFDLDRIRIFVVEKDELIQVSHDSVRSARHLSEIERLRKQRSTEAPITLRAYPLEKMIEFSDSLIGILVGGRSDLKRLESSGLLTILRKVGLRYEVSVISSEQNPEELRNYCQELANRNVALLICIAGSVPGLPAAVKAHLPAVPVIGVPLGVPDFDARDILLASFSVPARRPVILSGMNEVGLKKAAYLACEIIATSSSDLRRQYDTFLRENTPSPDLNIAMSSVGLNLEPLPQQVEEHLNGNGRRK